MRGGFSFCGVDVAKFGLEYVPPLDQTYVFGSAPYEVHQETFDAHHGGYFYGITVQPKDFILKCFYQDQHIAHGSLSAIENFFRRGKTGRLVFEHREWLWYTATVVDVDLRDLRNYSNGFVTITLRAYYPFSRHDYISVGDENVFDYYLAANSGLLSDDETPVVSFDSLKESVDIMLYNGGSERASVAIALAGDAKEGITITNKTTNQTAKFVAFDMDITTNAGKYIVSDALNGKTVLTDGTISEFGFLYHDYGFIELEPSYPIERDVFVSYTKGFNKISIVGSKIGDDVIGRHINIGNEWNKIIGKENDELIVDHVLSETGSQTTNIVTMNEIRIELSQGAELTKLNFIYKPTFQ